MLTKNKIYTTNDLIAIFGGNVQSSMPFVSGEVIYCKFNPKINPDFPNKAWIEVGPRRRKGALYLAQCNKRIPVFEKVHVNGWKYLGKALISDVTNEFELKKINKSPPRDKIQIILKFKFD